MWALISRATSSPESMRSLKICFLYAATSSSISLVYKGLLSSYGYNAKFSMLAMQLILSLTLCAVAKRWLSHVPGLEVPSIDRNTLKMSLLPGVLFVCNIVVGWYGLQLVNVPMFLAIRRTNAAFTLVAEWVLLSKASTLPVVQSVCLIVLGAVITGWESLQSDWLGIVYTIGNNVFTAASMSLTKQFSDRTGVRGFGVVLYNAVVALPLCLIGAFLSNEVQYTFDVTQFPSGHSPLFWASFITASSMGVFMSYIVFLCTTVNSPLATSITGNIKDIASTLVAALLFSDFKATGMNMLGLFVSFAGAAWFSIVKLQQMQQPLLPTKKGDPLTSSVLHFDSAANSGNTGGGNSSSSGTTMEAQPSPQQVQLQLNEASSYTSDAIAPSPASDAYSLRNSSGVYHAAAGRRRGGAGEVVTSLP